MDTCSQLRLLLASIKLTKKKKIASTLLFEVFVLRYKTMRIL